MKRQEKYQDTKTFHYHNANPKNRITGDCTFRAVSTALEQPWEQTVMEMAELSCKTGYAINDKKGIERYLKSKGWVMQKQPKKPNGTKYTGKEFCELIQHWVWDDEVLGCEWKDGVIIEHNIIANVGGHHIVAIIDGVIYDTWNSGGGCVGNYWTKGWDEK